MDFDDSPPELIAEAIAEEIGRDVDYRDVEVDGAARAARRLAELPGRIGPEPCLTRISLWFRTSGLSPPIDALAIA